MLDNETKRRINSLRDILVGKLPDPKAQVEQITNGLIYKFMDDMDQESVALGGKATFFSGKYKKYTWRNLLDSKISGSDKVSLYSEAIESMYNNENIPELFREIFKNSTLPFKDPATFNMFIKEINEFNYSNSEKIGDAYEYLLSFMGSQGDAGQFRTPRHIIDFLVEIIGPKKNQTILDPSCGTAGFLISSFKHILKMNSKKDLGDQLNSSDRKKLTENLNGYDISPDMVKMSLVNLYLHKFKNPKVVEYDTLTDDTKWNEYYDIILANPPFFSPKGGIKPHNKFSIKSKKAEVLFVDYILQHLKPDGRTGIIVPDGVIANSPTAFKTLRENSLNNQSLFCVISLPSGIFLPYSSSKTSILLYDKSLKTHDISKILFIEIFNDGYQLSQTRKKIDKNDLPDTINLLKEYVNCLRKNKSFEPRTKVSHLIVNKKEILETPSVSLSGKRYKKDINLNSEWEIVNLNEDYIYQEKERAKSKTKEEVWSVSNKLGFIPSEEYFSHKISSDNLEKYKIIKKNYFAYNPARFNVGSIALNSTDKTGIVSPMYVVFKVKDEKILNPEFLLLLLKSKMGIKQVRKFSDGAIRQVLSYPNLKYFKIPLPPLNEQLRILKDKNEIKKLESKIQIIEKSIFTEISKVWGIDDNKIDVEEINTDNQVEDDIDEYEDE